MALGQLVGTLEDMSYDSLTSLFISDLGPLIRQDNKILRNPSSFASNIVQIF
jgi:hypothetical protein